MRKGQLRRLYLYLRRAPYWSFLVLAGVLFIISAFSLRANNQKMIELREAVFIADREDGDVETALRRLREHVYAHMNTDLAAGENAIRPPIQLKYRYERLLEAEQAKLQTGSSGDIYTQAQQYCEQRFPSGFSGSNRLPCIREYLDQHGSGQMEEIVIPEDLYKFDFASPRWSPDLAGFSLLGGVVSLIAFLIFAAGEFILKRQIKRRI